MFYTKSVLISNGIPTRIFLRIIIEFDMFLCIEINIQQCLLLTMGVFFYGLIQR